MSKYCIGIDLGGTFIKFGLLSADGKPSETAQLPTPRNQGGDAIVATMIEGSRQVIASAGLTKRDILAVGIGSPGPLCKTDGVILKTANLPGMTNYPLRDRLCEGLSLPGILENDANAAAYGEFICGAGAKTRNMVMFTLGTGVGGGIIINGSVFDGSHEIGGELGHIIVQDNGRQCGCGQRGCLEQYSSATSLAKIAVELIGESGSDGILAKKYKSSGSIDAKDVCDAKNAGDDLATNAWAIAVRFLAVGCVDICRSFDPCAIVLGGGLAKAGDDLLAPLTKQFRQMHWSLTDIKTEIVLAHLGNDAGVVGAAGVAMQEFSK